MDGLVCKHCKKEVLMDQAHCMVCPAWEDIRQELDMTNMLDLVKFFKGMLDKLDKLEKERKRVSQGSAQHDSDQS